MRRLDRSGPREAAAPRPTPGAARPSGTAATAVPAIPAVPASSERPFLSIMVPTWRPHPAHLERAVRSALSQVEADRKVQIALVDDCSTDFDPHAFARRFDPALVSAHRHDRRLGLAGNWNACIARALGRWVHILHQDDYVLPGFYEALRRGIDQESRAAAAFCASHFVDEAGAASAPRLVPETTPGILRDWLQHVFVRLAIQCSAIVVRRDVYESLGGFDPDFGYALDWDMWKRIAVRYPIWYHPEPLACYRMHPGSETARQRLDGSHLVEVFRSIDRSAALLPPGVAKRVVRRARSHYAVFAAENALAVLRTGRWSAALRHLRIARRSSSSPVVIAALARLAMRGSARALIRSRRGR